MNKKEKFSRLYGYNVVVEKDGHPSVDFKIGDLVFDDLTGWNQIYTIKKVTGRGKILGYWIDSDYLDGGRHPWEITKVVKCGEPDEL